MPPLAEDAHHQGNIMIVDDNPANLKLLEDMLRQQGYEARLFPLGRLALAAADKVPPDLILLDINMPEMNGYEVCERLKSSPRLCEVPVIFISALNATEDTVKGFRAGGVDYISKPFQLEEVQVRLETQLKLRRTQQAEGDLLEKTLGGVVETLWELVQVTSPALALRSRAIRDIVLLITKQTGIKYAWQYELAATLCLVGCVSLPDDVFDRAYCHEGLSPEEDRMFRAHPERAARLLSNIPRLEVVAEMIRGQQRHDAISSLHEQAREGAQMLHLALELDRRIYTGVSPGAALNDVALLGRFDSRMLDALKTYSPTREEFEVRRLPVRDLRAGMVLEKDVLRPDRNFVVLKQGTVLTATWIERLENFVGVRGVSGLVDVRIPKTHAPRRSI
jgi:DNA-binding response OmpR family regulator